jgi:hypothetical protein
MTAITGATIDKVSSEGAGQELATLLNEVPIARDLTRQPGESKHWRFVVRAVRTTPVPERYPDRGVTNLDYAAWHGHLAGTRRWTPDRQRGPSA